MGKTTTLPAATMIYLKTPDDKKLLILDTANLERLRKGLPVSTPECDVVIAWTPDVDWLLDQFQKMDGTINPVGDLISESLSRPEKPASPGRKTEMFFLK